MAQDASRFAVLIDANNASAAAIKELLEEVAKCGVATVKRSYGDRTTQNLVGWKDYLHRHATQPMRQFTCIKGKNSMDSVYITDAMDLLYGGNVDGFCLVSSDSDFTRLVIHLREVGKVAYGLGERKTPDALIMAYDKSVSVGMLRQPATGIDPGLPAQVKDVSPLHGLLSHAVKKTQCDMGWSSLPVVGSFINKNHVSFDPRNYDFNKLSDLVRKQHHYLEVKGTIGAAGFNHLYIKLKWSHLDDPASSCMRECLRGVKSRNLLAALGRKC